MGVMRESAGWTALPLSAMGSSTTHQEPGQTLRWKGRRKGGEEMDALQREEMCARNIRRVGAQRYLKESKSYYRVISASADAP